MVCGLKSLVIDMMIFTSLGCAKLEFQADWMMALKFYVIWGGCASSRLISELSDRIEESGEHDGACGLLRRHIQGTARCVSSPPHTDLDKKSVSL